MSNTSIMTHRNSSHPSLFSRTVFDNIFDNFFSDIPSHIQRSTRGYPVVDIYQDDEGGTVLEFALAGFKKSDLNVDVQPADQTITISAESTSDSDGVIQRRIARRNFKKTFVNYNNNLDLGSSVAKFENGLLVIEIPQKPETKPQAINII